MYVKKTTQFPMANQKAVFIAKFCKFMHWYDDRRKLTFKIDFSLRKYFNKKRNTPTSSIKTVIMAGFSYWQIKTYSLYGQVCTYYKMYCLSTTLKFCVVDHGQTSDALCYVLPPIKNWRPFCSEELQRQSAWIFKRNWLIPTPPAISI